MKDFKHSKNFKHCVGFTTANYKNNIITSSHTGNMGNSIDMSVNPNLKLMNIETIQELKDKYKLIEEFGNPDYAYTIKFKIK